MEKRFASEWKEKMKPISKSVRRDMAYKALNIISEKSDRADLELIRTTVDSGFLDYCSRRTGISLNLVSGMIPSRYQDDAEAELRRNNASLI